MADGRIVQRGQHAALLKEGGLYRQIYDLQLSQQNRIISESDVDEELLLREQDQQKGKDRPAADRSLS